MRDLLGGKGANVAEMTRILGAERVPAGFTITTEACVAYMDADRSEPDGLDEQVAEALARLEERGRQAARRRRRPAARLGPLRRARVDAGHDGHGPQPRPQRRVGRGARGARPATRASRGTPTAASCRCSATSCAASPASSSRTRSRQLKARARREARHRARRRRAARADATASRRSSASRPARTSRRTRRSSCARRSAPCSTRGWASARSTTAASTASPTTGARRSTCSRWCSATRATTSGSGVAFSRDEVTGAPEPSGDFLQNAQGEDVVSGVRNTRDIAELADVMPEAHAELMEILRTLEAPLRRHAGHRVHDRGGAPVHAADAQREAPGAGGGALRRRRGRRGPARRASRR